RINELVKGLINILVISTIVLINMLLFDKLVTSINILRNNKKAIKLTIVIIIALTFERISACFITNQS
ncbi:MAG: hypothetical protein NZZ41_07885, partial [Candidatus Dojkabacteria bacterium]|nr:hypothetical protein [Candidatus Dojkabacteria bacterium]